MVFRFGLVIALALGLGASSAWAGDTPKGSGRDKAPDKAAGRDARDDGKTGTKTGATGDASRFIERFDANNDRALQKNELPKRLSESFKALDRNNDGKLDRSELSEHAQAMMDECTQCEAIYVLSIRATTHPMSAKDLQRAYETLREIDANNDGKLTKDEVRSAKSKVMQRWAEARMEELDRNNDNKLSREELGGIPKNAFSKHDRNGNGFLDSDELVDAITREEQTRSQGLDTGTEESEDPSDRRKDSRDRRKDRE